MKNVIKSKVYYSDTDAGGVVYYANYLKWMEAGRTELIEGLGISLKELLEKEKRIFAVSKVEVEYLSPAKLYDEITVETSITAKTGVSIEFLQAVKRGKEELAEGKVTLVCLNSESMKPARLPVTLSKKFIESQKAR